MLELLTSLVNLSIGQTTLKLSVHEDNLGALVLAKTLPPQFTPQSKYYAIKTIWFCKKNHKHCIQLLKIVTVKELGDIFTKGLPQVAFEYLWKKIIRWWVMGHKAQGAFTLHVTYCILFRSLHCHKDRITELGRNVKLGWWDLWLVWYCEPGYSTEVLSYYILWQTDQSCFLKQEDHF